MRQMIARWVLPAKRECCRRCRRSEFVEIPVDGQFVVTYDANEVVVADNVDGQAGTASDLTGLRRPAIA
jgi:hypothetical protein